MRTSKYFIRSLATALAALVLLSAPASRAQTPAAPAAAKPAAAPATAAEAAPLKLPIRIKAGVTTPYTDSKKNVWLPDQGFVGGDTVARDDSLAITNTPDQEFYRTEHYSMDSWSTKVANGKYIVKLYFCETFDGITAAGQRVFSFKVGGKEFKDVDLFAKVGYCKPYIETVPVEVTDGKITITFTSNIENPEINGIEVTAAP